MDRDKLSDDEKFKLLRKYDRICLKNIGKNNTYKGLTQCKKKLVNNMCPIHGADITCNKWGIVDIIKEKLDLIEKTPGEKRKCILVRNLFKFIADNLFGFLHHNQKFTITIHDKFCEFLLNGSYIRKDSNRKLWLKIYESYLKVFPLKSKEKHLDYYYKISKKDKSKKRASGSVTLYPEQMTIVV